MPGNYGAFYENVCDAIAGRAPLAVTPEDAIQTLGILELALQSSLRNGLSIQVP